MSVRAQCPVCFGSLEPREVSPCDCCGAEESERHHYRTHRYAECDLGFGLSLILCDFCQVDFGSFAPGFFGLAELPRSFRLPRQVAAHYNTDLRKDLVCTNCGHRLSFLRFVARVRELGKSGELR